ncbi:hypothetical protein AB0436_13535 [Streptomyces sp. NPDC051322]|uniref:hypothetical protein n=1 Tax=Streptomyces sp. NPDC051322 TaxID=3154645 RepID=UPI00344E77AE
MLTSTKKVTAAMLSILNRKQRMPALALGATVILALATSACTSGDSEPRSGASSPASDPASANPSPSTTLSDAQLRKQAEAALPKGKAVTHGGALAKNGVIRRKTTKLRWEKRYVLEVVCVGAGAVVMHFTAESTGASGDIDIACGRRPGSFAFAGGDGFSFEVRPSHADGFVAWQVVQRDYKGS